MVAALVAGPHDSPVEELPLATNGTAKPTSASGHHSAPSALAAPFTGPGYVGGDDATPGMTTVEVRETVNISSTTQRWLRVKVTH